MGSFVQLTSADGFHCPAYVAQPTGQPKGGLVVLQEIFGVNSHIQAVADGYAAEGYFVVAPSTFHRVKAGVDLGYTEADMGAGMALKTAVEALPPPGVMADIQAAIRLAAQHAQQMQGVEVGRRGAQHAAVERLGLGEAALLVQGQGTVEVGGLGHADAVGGG